ncbi:MAG: 23S rRNA (guanosine(2251)-2'-O)-methyltransferase RlmB [Actinobacteria bacterium]|nr:23S rRNA (guanosine(2251)-2'-O)-methyltransferase RlmB [Actinomycetota bacterium]
MAHRRQRVAGKPRGSHRVSTPDEVDERLVYGRRPVLEHLIAGAATERLLVAQEASRGENLNEILRRAEAGGVRTRRVPRSELDRLSGGGNHQGVAVLASRFRYVDVESLLASADATILILDGVMDPHNFGSLLRSADGAGFGGVVIRSRRAAQVTAAVRRVSAGAAEFVPVARVPNSTLAVERAKDAGLWVVGLDEDADDDLWTSSSLEPPVALVLGSEDKGIAPKVREKCDETVRIPSRGRVGSLNVSVAGAIAMFEVARRRG